MGVDRGRTEREGCMEVGREEMALCGGGWGGTELQDAEIGTKPREGEMRGRETEIAGKANWGSEERDR